MSGTLLMAVNHGEVYFVMEEGLCYIFRGRTGKEEQEDLSLSADLGMIWSPMTLSLKKHFFIFTAVKKCEN